MGRKLGSGIGRLNPPKMGGLSSPVGAGLAPPGRKKRAAGPIGAYKIGRKTKSKKMGEIFG